ncbi:chorismate-binding protein [Polaribacter cellanae]|uniref:isochorismate synthase n=2 Tax=Polaribacter cellanae TaxID=2818493 RepID=A0A975CT00_9FLAO|nr:chorismate-binding protein [Polaribacter cellanae]
MQEDALHYSKNYSESGFVFAPFNSEEKAILFPVEKAEFLQEKIDFKIGNSLKKTFISDNSSKEKHLKIVEKAINFIKMGTIQKVVISRQELVSLQNFDLVAVYKKLLLTYENAFVYVWFHPKVGLWLGATPETLLEVEEKVFKTMSLAGTQVANSKENIVWKSKELEEQQLVTDFIEQQLEKIANTLKINKTETIKAGSLLHLKTKVSGRLNKKSTLKELISALHPTPAVCGLPRKIAKQFILEKENYKRSFYTGFLGEINFNSSQKGKKETHLFVNLRCMKIDKNTACIYVGGGITKGSIATKEWEETVSKAKTMKRVL